MRDVVKRRAAAGLLSLTMSACMGTAATRQIDPLYRSRFTQPIGFPLFAAVTSDARVVADGGGCRTGPLFVALAFCSFPLDVTLDVVLSPLDVLAGAFGCRRIAAGVGGDG